MSSLNMVLSQSVPLTGGSFFVQSGIQRVDVGGNEASRLYSSSPVTVGFRQDIFRPNALKWDSREQDLVTATADRQYLESREDVALTAANAFFDVHSARLALDNAVAKVAINDTLFNLNKGRFEVGKIGENDLLQSELALLQARAQTDAARLAFDQAIAALKRLLSLPPDAPLEITPPVDVPLTQVDTALAVQQALRTRASLRATSYSRCRRSVRSPKRSSTTDSVRP